MADDSNNRRTPPYIPWETFTSFVGHLKSTVTPSRIDKSAMPSGMKALVRGQVQSALKFLDLTDSNGTTLDSLRHLVKAYDTEEWQHTVVDTLLGPYSDILGELDVDHATQHQLDERFQQAGIDGQMLLKCVRFYLAIMTAGGLTFSPHLASRRKTTRTTSGSLKRKKIAVSKPAESTKGTEPPEISQENSDVTMTYPMFFKNKVSGKIVVPSNLSADDRKVVELTVALILAYAEQT